MSERINEPLARHETNPETGRGYIEVRDPNDSWDLVDRSTWHDGISTCVFWPDEARKLIAELTELLDREYPLREGE